MIEIIMVFLLILLGYFLKELEDTDDIYAVYPLLKVVMTFILLIVLGFVKYF